MFIENTLLINWFSTRYQEQFISPIAGILNLLYGKKIKDTCMITLSESFLKETVPPNIFEEFPFLLAETVRPKVLNPENFHEFEIIYLQILKEYQGGSPYLNRLIDLFVVLLLKIKKYFWKDYNLIYESPVWRPW